MRGTPEVTGGTTCSIGNPCKMKVFMHGCRAVQKLLILNIHTSDSQSAGDVKCNSQEGSDRRFHSNATTDCNNQVKSPRTRGDVSPRKVHLAKMCASET